MAKSRPQLGDLVKFRMSKHDRPCIGLVKGTSRDWWVIKGHMDVSNHIAPVKFIEVIQKKAVPKSMIKYM